MATLASNRTRQTFVRHGLYRRHLKWRENATLSLRLFEDKMTLLRRVEDAEDALLARTLADQEAALYSEATATHAGQAYSYGDVDLQRALSSSLQSTLSREEEDLQLALAISASASAAPALEALEQHACVETMAVAGQPCISPGRGMGAEDELSGALEPLATKVEMDALARGQPIPEAAAPKVESPTATLCGLGVQPQVQEEVCTQDDASIDAVVVQVAGVPQEPRAQTTNGDEDSEFSESMPGTTVEEGVPPPVGATSENTQRAQEPAAVASVTPSVEFIEGDDVSIDAAIVHAFGIPKEHGAQGGNGDEHSGGWFGGWFAA